MLESDYFATYSMAAWFGCLSPDQATLKLDLVPDRYRRAPGYEQPWLKF